MRHKRIGPQGEDSGSRTYKQPGQRWVQTPIEARGDFGWQMMDFAAIELMTEERKPDLVHRHPKTA